MTWIRPWEGKPPLNREILIVESSFWGYRRYRTIYFEHLHDKYTYKDYDAWCEIDASPKIRELAEKAPYREAELIREEDNCDCCPCCDCVCDEGKL